MSKMMYGMVDTSGKPSIVRELKLTEVSYRYEERMKDIEDDVLRFDFPKDLSVKLGTEFDVSSVNLYLKDNTLVFSVLEQDIEQPIKLRPYLFKEDGDPRSCVFDEANDSQFFVIPKYFAEVFEVGDDITYTYVHETEDVERHVTCHVT